MVLFGLYQAAIIYGTVVGLLALGLRITQESSGYMNLGYTVNLGVGMMFGFLVIQQLNITPILSASVSFIFTGLFNLIVYTLFYLRMERRGYSEILIALFGVASMYVAENVLTVIEYVLRLNFPSSLWCGPAPIRFSTQHLHYGVSNTGILREGIVEIVLIFTGIILLYRWIYYNKQGILLRAVGENPGLVEVSGINSTRVKMAAWFIAGGLAGVAGVITPYAMKGEMGRDVQLFFPMIAAALMFEKRGSWVAGLSGLLVGFSSLVLLTWGQAVIGVWVGEYWNLVPWIILILVLSLKDQRKEVINWVNQRRL